MHTCKFPCGRVLSCLLGSCWEYSRWRNRSCCNPPASLGTSEVWTVPVGLECMDSEKQMRQVLCPIAQRLTCVVGRRFPSRNLALNPPFAPHLFKAEEPRAGQHRRAGMSFETRLLGTQAPIHPFWQVDGSQHLRQFNSTVVGPETAHCTTGAISASRQQPLASRAPRLTLGPGSDHNGAFYRSSELPPLASLPCDHLFGTRRSDNDLLSLE